MEVPPVDQAVIDAKCKELTVLPLADISEAYEQAATKEVVAGTIEQVAHKVRSSISP